MTRLWFVILLLCCHFVQAQERFVDLLGPTPTESVKNDEEMPYLTWGADLVTFLANGRDFKPNQNSDFGGKNLKFNLVKGDDFVNQVRRYKSGKTPWLRGTMGMLAMAYDALNDKNLQPVVILQLSYSSGDHIVARKEIKNVDDVKNHKKFKIAVQKGGPHVLGLLDEFIHLAQIKKDQIEIVWCNEITGPNSPADLFAKDNSISACCVITPDLITLTGGLNSVGSNAEGNILGSHAILSTTELKRSIADVIACRRDYYEKNKDKILNFVAIWLETCDTLVKERKNAEDNKKMSQRYRDMLKSAQIQFGKDVIKNELDAHGLLMDCNFIGLAGQMAFFKDKGNLSGFDAKTASYAKTAKDWGITTENLAVNLPVYFTLDYKKISEITSLSYQEPQYRRQFAGEAAINIDDIQDDNTLATYTVNFGVDQSTFNVDDYAEQFRECFTRASNAARAKMVIVGHADPALTLSNLIRAGLEKGIITKTGNKPNIKYFLKGKPFDLNQTATMVAAINSGEFDGTKFNPKLSLQEAYKLSEDRGKSVMDAIMLYSQNNSIKFDPSQFTVMGAGIREPIIPKPTSIEDSAVNMRVEFKLIKVQVEASSSADYDF